MMAQTINSGSDFGPLEVRSLPVEQIPPIPQELCLLEGSHLLCMPQSIMPLLNLAACLLPVLF